MNQISLVDNLALELRLDYVSDFRFPDKLPVGKLNYLLNEKISAEDYPEKDWVDACEYLCGAKSKNRQEARRQIQEYISKLFC